MYLLFINEIQYNRTLGAYLNDKLLQISVPSHRPNQKVSRQILEDLESSKGPLGEGVSEQNSDISHEGNIKKFKVNLAKIWNHYKGCPKSP